MYPRIIFFKDCRNAVFIFYIWRVNWRWNITAIIVALAFFGISLDQSNTDPNQEILVQFNTDSISADQAQWAISDIKNQLRAIGVEDVQVSETLDGRLKVTYYSEVDVAVIKNLFYKKNKLQLATAPICENEGTIPFPLSNDSNTYLVEVIQIQSDFNTDIGIQGVLVEVKSASDQYVKPKVSLDATEVNFDLKYNVESELSTGYSSLSLFVENTTYRIPESRAGPFS